MFKDRPSEVRISGTTEIYTYILHFEAAKFALEVAKEPRAGSFYHSLHCIVSTAFGLEAFLNHIGRRLFPSEPKFKWRRPDEKFQAVCTKLGFTPDMGVSPYQAFGQAFATRDLAAHSETVVRTFDRPAPPKDELPAHERSPLELECTTAKAERLFSDAMQLVRDLHKRAGLTGDPFVIAVLSSWVEG